MKKLLLLLLLFVSLCTFAPPPVNSPGKGLILLTFDGFTPTTPVWGHTHFNNSGLYTWDKQAVQERVALLYSSWDVTVTTDDSIFYAFPQNRRIRCVITEDTLFVPGFFFYIPILIPVGGRANINALANGDTTPAVISTVGLTFAVRPIGDATAHEVGHTLGLQHQSKWENGVKVQEYNPGNWYFAPIMGVSYWSMYSGWTKGYNREGVWQNDDSIISLTFRRMLPYQDSLLQKRNIW